MNGQQTFTQAEIETMRAMVQQHDSQNASINREFDLNNPPKVPYVHQEFPRIIYQHEKRRHKAIQNAKELADALQQGWRLEPYPQEVANDVELDEQELAEVRAIDKLARKKKAAAK